MPRKVIKRYLPNHHKLRENKYLKVFGDVLHEPGLWHLNKRSVAGAFSVGLFTAFVPLPMQMLIAAAGAILFRVNLPISAGLVWITNPVTIPPIFYFAYRLGTMILDVPARSVEFELSVAWLQSELTAVWQPFLLGCFLLALGGGIAGNILARLLWRAMVVRSWTERKRLRRKKAPSSL